MSKPSSGSAIHHTRLGEATTICVTKPCSVGSVSRVTRAALVCLVALPHLASADSVTIPPHKVQVIATTEMSLSKDKELEPVSLAPDVSYGLTPTLMVSFISSGYGTTGFRGSAGSGLCLTTPSHGCAHLFNSLGGETVFGLSKGAAAIGLVGGVYSLNVDASFIDVKVGAKSRFTWRNAALLFNPSYYVGLNRRDAMVPNTDQVYLPVGLSYKLDPQFAIAVGSGVKSASVKGFTDKYQIPLGFSAVATINPELSIGAAFTWGRLWGAKALRDMTPPGVGEDFRFLQVWAVITI